MLPTIFGGNTGITYEDLKRKQLVAESLLAQSSKAPRNVGEGLTAIGNALAGRVLSNRAEKRQKEMDKSSAGIMTALLGGGTPPIMPPRTGDTPNVGPVTPNTGAANTGRTTPTTGGSIFSGLLAKTEGGGKYDTLFGFSNRPGGQFAGVDITKMTLDELAEFTKPSGAYGQWVKAELGRQGQTPRVATPLGAGQIVGSTLRRAAAELGLPGDTVFSPEIQDKLIAHLAKGRLRPGMSQEAKRAAMRAEWHGFKSVSNADLDAAIAEIEGGAVGGAGAPTTPPATGGNAGAGTAKIAQLMAALSNPSLSPQHRQVVQMMLAQEMARNKAPDPIAMRRLQLAENADARAAAAAKRGVLESERDFELRQREIDGSGVKAPKTVTIKRDDGSDVVVQWNKDTGVWDPINAPKGAAAPDVPGKLSENQSKLTLFSSLMKDSGPILAEIEEKWDPANIQDALARSLPIGESFFSTPEGQAYNAAARQWAEGALRIATGAAAQDQEIARQMLTYFAAPGDRPATVEFKRRLRASYERAIQRALGNKVDGVLELPKEFWPEEYAKKYAKENDGKEDKKPSIPGTSGAVDGPAVLDMKSLPSSVRDNAGISDETKRELAELLAGAKSPEERAAILKSIGLSDD